MHIKAMAVEADNFNEWIERKKRQRPSKDLSEKNLNRFMEYALGFPEICKEDCDVITKDILEQECFCIPKELEEDVIRSLIKVY